MGGSSRREVALNLGTAALVAVALGALIHDRLIPLWQERRRIDPGETIPSSLAFELLTDTDTITIERGRPALLLVFRSTCQACDKAVPVWSELATAIPGAALAVALEGREPALEYASDRLPAATPVRPLEEQAFVDRFRIRVVPTTLVIDAGGRLRIRREGPLEETDARLIASAMDDVLYIDTTSDESL
jgi:thiol-disulfide isomerase/thioredoxin